VSQREHPEVQQSRVQNLAPGLQQPPQSIQSGGGIDRAQFYQKGLQGPGGWQAGHEPAVCLCSPESQLYPGLHPKKRGQQHKGGDSTLLPCTGRASSGVLHPHVEPSVQGRHGPIGMCPEEGHKNDPRDGTRFLHFQKLMDGL